MAGTRNYQSIGEVLVSVKTEFPDITISKIRFLESEGLIEPERTPSGYRKFYVDDVERLKSILRMQRDEYLPLKVIKERLLNQEARRAVRRGRRRDRGPERRRPTTTRPRSSPRRPTGLQMSLEEMSAATGVERERIKELEGFGIVCSHGPEGRRYYDGDDYIVLSIVKDFFRYGIEPRHLTMYKHFADREAAFFETHRRAHAPPEEPRRAPRGLPDARRSGGHVTQVQAGAAPDQPPRPSAQRVSHRRRASGACALIVAVGVIGRPRDRARVGAARTAAAHAGPPDGSLSPFPSVARHPADAAVRPGSRHPARSSRISTRGRCCSRRRPTPAPDREPDEDHDRAPRAGADRARRTRHRSTAMPCSTPRRLRGELHARPAGRGAALGAGPPLRAAARIGERRRRRARDPHLGHRATVRRAHEPPRRCARHAPHTVPLSANGLDDRGLSTARDLLTLARAADGDPGVRARSSATRFRTIPGPEGTDAADPEPERAAVAVPGRAGAKTGSTARSRLLPRSPPPSGTGGGWSRSCSARPVSRSPTRRRC